MRPRAALATAVSLSLPALALAQAPPAGGPASPSGPPTVSGPAAGRAEAGQEEAGARLDDGAVRDRERRRRLPPHAHRLRAGRLPLVPRLDGRRRRTCARKTSQWQRARLGLRGPLRAPVVPGRRGAGARPRRRAEGRVGGAALRPRAAPARRPPQGAGQPGVDELAVEVRLPGAGRDGRGARARPRLGRGAQRRDRPRRRVPGRCLRRRRRQEPDPGRRRRTPDGSSSSRGAGSRSGARRRTARSPPRPAGPGPRPRRRRASRPRARPSTASSPRSSWTAAASGGTPSCRCATARSAMRGEYLEEREERRGQGPSLEDLPDVRGRGFQVAATWLVTGEKKTRTIRPERAAVPRPRRDRARRTLRGDAGRRRGEPGVRGLRQPVPQHPSGRLPRADGRDQLVADRCSFG